MKQAKHTSMIETMDEFTGNFIETFFRKSNTQDMFFCGSEFCASALITQNRYSLSDEYRSTKLGVK